MKAKDNEREKYLYICSKRAHPGARPCKIFKAHIVFDEQDWNEFCEKSESHGLAPERFLEDTLSAVVKARSVSGRISHIEDRRRLSPEYTVFSEKFARYLIYAHLSVLFGGVFFEYLLGGGRSYLIFYIPYLISLSLAVLSWLGYNFKKFVEEGGHTAEGFGIEFEIQLARLSEKLSIASVGVFAATVTLRFVVGFVQFASYLAGD